jgi:hypothetical protein
VGEAAQCYFVCSDSLILGVKETWCVVDRRLADMKGLW